MESLKPRPQRARRVFISSTSIDLVAHRQQVHDILERLGQFAVDMAQFGAQSSGDAISISTDKVASAEVYLGIVAWRYGYIPPGEICSVTHLEYLEARRLGLPCFLFLARPESDHDQSLFPAAVRDPDHRQQLLAFRTELQSGPVVDYFTTPDDLAKRIAAALHEWLLKQQTEEFLTGQRPPRHLPPRVEGFIGRELEMQSLCARLRQGQSVALAAAVSGMGGVGKSALAAEAMHTLATEPETFPGGLAWVRCDERRDLSGLIWVYDRLLDAWNIPIAAEELSAASTLEAEADLRERTLRFRLRVPGSLEPPPALVLLDNVEQALPISRALEVLSALHITVLLTTRAEPSVPRLHLVRLEVLEQATAVRLFAERYADRGGDWNEPRDGPAAGEVARALGYLPLALELAAARAARQRLSVAMLAHELQQPGVLAKLKDPLDPTASVRYSFSKSLDLLTHTKRLRFAALGLPDGPDWPRPIGERLLSAIPTDSAAEDTAADDLELLVALSLVNLASLEPPSNEPGHSANLPELRVRLHPLLRQLAREEWTIQPSQVRAAVLIALLDEVKDLVEAHKSDFARLAREEELIAGTLRRATNEHVAPHLLGDTIDAFFDYLDIGGHWRLGMELVTLQRNARRDLGDQRGEGASLNRLGSLAQALGRSEQATYILEQALQITRQVGDRHGEGRALNNLGNLADRLGRKEEAETYYQQALDIFRQVGDRRGEGSAYNNLGLLADTRGQKERAIGFYEQALAIEREMGDRRGEGRTLNNLGLLLDSQGQKEQAAAYYQQALARRREVGDRAGEANTLGNFGLLADSQGRKAEAGTYYEQALVIQREIGDRRGEGRTLNNLGLLTDRQGQEEETIRFYQQALDIARETGDRRGEWRILNNLVPLAHRQGRAEEAASYYQQASVIWQELGYRPEGESTPIPPGSLEETLQQKARYATYAQPAPVIQDEEEKWKGEPATFRKPGRSPEILEGKPAGARHPLPPAPYGEHAPTWRGSYPAQRAPDRFLEPAHASSLGYREHAPMASLPPSRGRVLLLLIVLVVIAGLAIGAYLIFK
jgi:tetratricopeptide (TPR) repeat protein/Mrp family chromosome partitioning ATPase